MKVETCDQEHCVQPTRTIKKAQVHVQAAIRESYDRIHEGKIIWEFVIDQNPLWEGKFLSERLSD